MPRNPPRGAPGHLPISPPAGVRTSLPLTKTRQKSTPGTEPHLHRFRPGEFGSVQGHAPLPFASPGHPRDDIVAGRHVRLVRRVRAPRIEGQRYESKPRPALDAPSTTRTPTRRACAPCAPPRPGQYRGAPGGTLPTSAVRPWLSRFPGRSSPDSSARPPWRPVERPPLVISRGPRARKREAGGLGASKGGFRSLSAFSKREREREP